MCGGSEGVNAPRKRFGRIVSAILNVVKLEFDEVKATQAAAQFLRLAKRPLNYMALIKLLYKADREAIRR